MCLKPNGRTGKIARLPQAVRHELNQRLDHGESGTKLLAWLNELPVVHEVLATEFAGKPIVKQNLSAWRKGGYQDWRMHQDTMELAQRFRQEAQEFGQAGGSNERSMAEIMAVWVTAHLGVAARQTKAAEGRERWRMLRQLCAEVVKLRAREQSSQRMQLQERRMELQRQKLENRRPGRNAGESAVPAGLEAKEVEAFPRASAMEGCAAAMAGPAPSSEPSGTNAGQARSR